MKPQPTFVPMVSIYPDRLTSYTRVDWHPHRPSRPPRCGYIDLRDPTNENFIKSKRTADGLVSPTAKRKITKTLDFLLLLASEKKAATNWNGRSFKFRVAFITLTLPSAQIHTDNEIKEKCLNQFLIEARKHYNVKNYLWRAEKQENGNIHFHLLVDKFIPWNEIRNRWNRIVNKLGYVDRYRENITNYHAGGFKLRKNLLKNWSAEKQLKAYQEGIKSQWNNPNSTDVHSIRKILNIKRYVTKYMIKNELTDKGLTDEQRERMKVKGRLWGCNQELSEAKAPSIEIDSYVGDEIMKLVNDTKCRVYQGDYFQVFEIDFYTLRKYPDTILFKTIAGYLLRQFSKEDIPLFEMN